MRADGRRPDELRPTEILPGFVATAHGSALISQGATRVICTASVEEAVPAWMRGRGRGWVTAEYSMLPASTGQRKARDISRGRLDGRTTEIQRLIGRSVRAVVDMEALGERTVWLDCDVLQADGGTRCASICGAWVALRLALDGLVAAGTIPALPLRDSIAAVSVGMVDGRALLDLPYAEDSRAESDMNVVMTGQGRLVEVQATAEGQTFSREELDALLDLAEGGIRRLTDAQLAAVA
ncbi:ribonuclease PH [Miltoncostaea marina]|uniref:ribonuclease PH n=1 Tax=Miltoncostaea marina TaxID=2843215 RepID=UPI001C3CE240|nr:ribonuclease PH [Miltoncostaea marina]